jgi:hypothetical protein
VRTPEDRAEAEEAVAWLEDHDNYHTGLFLADAGGFYTEYMASFKDDDCAATRDANGFCKCVSRRPQFVTGLPWNEQDDEAWMLGNSPDGNIERLIGYLTEVHDWPRRSLVDSPA